MEPTTAKTLASGSGDPTIAEFYKDITDNEDELLDKAELSEYWDKSADFWFEVKNKKLSTLSEKQQAWLGKMEDEFVR